MTTSFKEHYLLRLQYNGAHYFGWQKQPLENQPTVQSTIEKALVKLSGVGEFKLLGASRTDRGVHALEQVAKLSINEKLPSNSLIKALNDILPGDILVKDVSEVGDDFHPIKNCLKKKYCYYFAISSNKISPFCEPFITRMPYKVDMPLMQEAAKLIEGKHNFQNYYCEGTSVQSFVRTIFECRLREVENLPFEIPYIPSQNIYCLEIQGDGFLKQMIRLLVGALFNLGRGKITLDEFIHSLDYPIEKKLGEVAPPNGLYLVKIEY